MSSLRYRGCWLVLMACFGTWPAIAATNEARVLGVAGIVETAPPGLQSWSPATTNQVLKVAERLRTARNSRATLRLTDLSILRVAELSMLEIQPPDRPRYPSVLDLKAGAAYFFNRDKPGEARFRTPTVTGAIRGTEFHISVKEDGTTAIAMLDGTVELSNPAGVLVLEKGEQGIVEPGKGPVKTAAIPAKNIIQWTLYYPAVLDPADLKPGAELADSFSAYKAGDLLKALELHSTAPSPATGGDYFAGLLLCVGKVEEAEKYLQKGSPQANALKILIAAVNGETMGEISPRSSSEWLATSYYRQSKADLPGALAAARQAVKLSPEFGFARARAAELEFSFGRIEPAIREIKEAIRLSPRNAQAHATRGYLLAAQGNFKKSLESFEHSLALDSHLPTAWLGRGLVRMRLGNEEEAVHDFQTAAALEPTRAFYRDYLGKAYTERRDFSRARKEIELGKQLDPKDPTSWLYSALLHHERNEVNAAMNDLEKSKALNDNRAIYRSQFLLDQDRAVRSANLAAIYKDAGMREVSLREAAYAVNSDFANYSAHLFLADSYDFLRDQRRVNLRYETPWLSELLLANLLAPVGAVSLSQNVSQQEYSHLFDRERLGIISRTEYFSNGQWLQSGSQYGHLGKISYALDGEYRVDPGYRVNDDFEEKVLSAKVKFQLTQKDEIFLQAIHSEFDAGDLFQYHTWQTSAQFGQRVRETQEPIVFAGYHREWAPGIHTLFLGGRLRDDFLVGDTNAGIYTLNLTPAGNPVSLVRRPFNLQFARQFEAWSAELQQIVQRDDHTIIAGGRYQDAEVDPMAELTRPPRSFPPIYNTPASSDAFGTDYKRITAYLYHFWQIIESLQITAGLSYDDIEFPLNTDMPPLGQEKTETSRFNPKVGLQFRPMEGTTLRALYTKSLGGLFFDNSVRLEPTQIAGFNQAYRSIIPESVVGPIAGSEFETAGVGFDQRFPSKTYITLEAELLKSEAETDIGIFRFRPLTTRATTSSLRETLEYEEQSATIIVNQLLGEHWALGAQYRFSDSRLNDRFQGVPAAFSPDRTLRASLHTVRMHGTFNHRCGFFASGESVFNAQDLRGGLAGFSEDRFWQFNVYAGYRFLQRRAEVRLGLLNLTDEDYHLHPLTLYQELPHERMFTAALRLNF